MLRTSPEPAKIKVAAIQVLSASAPPNAAVIERHAQKIRDPILRLQFLREATAIAGDSGHSSPRWLRSAALLLLASILALRSDANIRRRPDFPPAPADQSATVHAAWYEAPNVWLVEGAGDYEVYSNGLRIETRLAVSNKPRSYPLIHRSNMRFGPRRAQPAGIVFHTTESDQAPFEAGQKRNLQRIGRELLHFVHSKRAYHYVIDRFGRVHRIVVESDEANHAGNSVWSDSQWLYMDLNASFVGVAFEATMQSDQPPINAGQMHAARILTEMLRSKYNMAAENCITHAQVSVNPDNMRVGWHSDWGKGFPFREIGLPNNYRQPLPSLVLFGFEYDSVYQNATGPDLWQGLALAESQVLRAAGEKRLALGQYRALLQQRYRDQVAAFRGRNANQEN